MEFQLDVCKNELIMKPQKLAFLVFVLSSFAYRVASTNFILLNDNSRPDACNLSSINCKDASNQLSCGSLDEVLGFVADCGDDDDVEIQVSKGRYELTKGVIIEKNLTIRAEMPGTVEVEVRLKDAFLIRDAEYVAFLIRNAEYAAVEGISFEGSEEIMVFENITEVFIYNSSFRYDNKV